MIDRRFATALQVMQNLVLAERQGMAFVSSAQFAEGLRANPTLVRRLLTTLVQRGLLVSQLGRNGGVRLARSPHQISLAEIYAASIAGKRLWEARTDLPHLCVVSTNFQQYFDALVADADCAIIDHLDQQSLADSFAALETLDRARICLAPLTNVRETPALESMVVAPIEIQTPLNRRVNKVR